jgi:hypothetical protein
MKINNNPSLPFCFYPLGIFTIMNIVCMLLLSVALAPCLPACTDDFPAHSRTFVLGSKSYATKIYRKELEKTPAWDAAEPNPPLAPGTAGRLALAQAGLFFPPHQGNAHAITSDPCSASDNAGMWEISSISLNQFSGSDYWYYIVELLSRGTTGRCTDAAAIGVLMDGRIIKPTTAYSAMVQLPRTNQPDPVATGTHLHAQCQKSSMADRPGISSNDLKHSIWNPLLPNPPLSFRAALGLATNVINNYAPVKNQDSQKTWRSLSDDEKA